VAGDNIAFALPLIESGQRYAPGALAKEIVNLQLTPEGTLRGVRGPAPLIPDYGAGYPWAGRVYGVYHARLDRGTRDVTLVRSGTTLQEQTGWGISSTPTRTLVTGLSSDPNARFPDCFVEVAGKIVWCNGIDTPRIYDGYSILPLGYSIRPGAPAATGPADSGHPVFRNQNGYSHPGKIGTPGNFFDSKSGAVLAGTWYYYVQFEDRFGNRSALSAAGGPAVIRQEYTKDLYWQDYNNYSADSSTTSVLGVTLYPGTTLGLLTVQIDDLTRQFLVSGIALGPAGTVARILYRTTGTDPTPRFLAREDNNTVQHFPDNTPDSALGDAAKDYIPVPTFGLAWEHSGCLVIADGRTIRMSDPFFPGSFERDMGVPLPDDPTGGFSFAGRCYATTETGLYAIEVTESGRLRARPLPSGKGMVAARSGAATDLGVYVGLGRDGFWSMDASEAGTDISDSIRPTFRRLVPGALSRAAGVWDPNRREYLCAVPEAGTSGNSLVLAWDGAGWRRRRYGISFSSCCVTKDWRRYVLAGGRRSSEDNVWALDRETGYNLPAKTYTYKSAWLRMDANGRNRFNVDAVYVGYVESVKGATMTVKVWQNGSRDTTVGPSAGHSVEMVAPSTTDVMDALVLGTGKTRTPRLTWKRIDTRVISAESFAFDLSSTSPMHIVGFSFDAYLVDSSGARVSRQ
jgi:hypothetical protein